MLSVLLPIVTVPYVSRVLGAEGLGKYAYTNAFAQYFILLGMIGISGYSSRQIAYVRDNKIKLNETFWELNILRFITVGISLIVYIIIFIIINKTDRLIYAILGLNILAAGVDISWFFIGIEDFKRTVTTNTGIKIVGVVLIFLLVKSPNQIWLYILILSLSQFFGQLVIWGHAPKKIKFKKIKLHNLKMHLMASFKLFIPLVAIQVYTLLDRTMLGWSQSISEVGIYDNSQKVIKLALTLLTSLSTVMMPYMSNIFAVGDMHKFKEKLGKSISFVSFMSIPMAVGLVAIAGNFVPWFYGKEFEHVEYLIYIGAWAMIPIAWSSVLSLQVMIPMKKENQYSISVFISAIINILLNLILIPKLKSTGTTISTVIAEYVGTIIQLYLLKGFINVGNLFKDIYKYVTGSFFMFLIIKCMDKYLKPSILSTSIEISIGTITYFIIMIIFKDEIIKTITKKIINKSDTIFNKITR